jgi:hypothetical protein
LKEEDRMKGHIECFCDECYCVVGNDCFAGNDALECMEDIKVKLKSGNYTGENAVFQKKDGKLCLFGVDFIIEDIEGIEIEMEE